MIKVVNVTSDANIGGAGKCILTFLKHYDRKKYDLTVIVPPKSLLIPEIEALGGKYIEVEGISDKSLDINGIKALQKAFAKIKPDIVHAHAVMSARIAAKISGAKIIYTRHSVFEPPKKISHGIGKFINGAVNNFFADKIIAVAEAAKDNLTKTGVSEKKITVIKNGVDSLKRYDAETIAKIKSNYGINDEFVLSIAARLTYVKGHKYILKAVKMLADDGENFKLIIAGTGEYEDEIKNEISALNLENNVIMAGFVKDVEALNNITDLNLNFSFGTEATSLSLLEGMSLGIPAVVSDFGGNPGVIRDNENGFLVPSKDYKSLYEKIKLAMDDKELYKRLCEGSRRIFESEFTADKVTRRIESVYDEVILQKEKRK